MYNNVKDIEIDAAREGLLSVKFRVWDRVCL